MLFVRNKICKFRIVCFYLEVISCLLLARKIEPNYNELKLNAIAYTFSKIFQLELTLNSSFAMVNSLSPSFWFPLRGQRVNRLRKKKKLSLLWKNSLSFGGIRNTKVPRYGETKRTKLTTKQDFSEEALSKQNIKA